MRTIFLLITIALTLTCSDAQAKVPTQTTFLLKQIQENLRSFFFGPKTCREWMAGLPTYATLLSTKDFVSTLAIKSSQISTPFKNALPFRNTEDDFACVAVRKFGFCGGMTVFTKKVAYLGFFDDANLSNAVIPDKKANYKLWIDFYINKLRNIADDRAAHIPGFKNLAQMDDIPELEEEMKRLSTVLWAKEAATFESMRMALTYRTTMQAETIQKNVADLVERVNRNELPRVLFSAKAALPSGSKNIHSVIIWKTEKQADETLRLYVWETNVYNTRSSSDDFFIEYRPDGTLFYQRWVDVYKHHPNVEIPKNAGQVARLDPIDADHAWMSIAYTEIKNFCKRNPVLCAQLSKSQ